jgi:mitochondrial fission protein ELM1
MDEGEKEMTEAGPELANQMSVWLFRSKGVGGFNLLKGAASHLNTTVKVVDIDRAGSMEYLAEVVAATYADILAEIRKDETKNFHPLIMVTGFDAMKVALSVKARAEFKVVIVKFNRTCWFVKGVDIWVHTKQFLSFFWQTHELVDLPFHDLTEKKFLAVKGDESGPWAQFPKPRMVALLGGKSRTLTWDMPTAISMMQQLKERAARNSATLFVSTSRRTGDAIANALKTFEDSSTKIHLWHDKSSENPFLDWLVIADLFVVTEDSISMLSETYSTGKAIEVYPLLPKKNVRKQIFQPFSLREIFGLGRIVLVRELIEAGHFSKFSADAKVALQSGKPNFRQLSERQQSVVNKIVALRTVNRAH